MQRCDRRREAHALGIAWDAAGLRDLQKADWPRTTLIINDS
ncbi:MAG: hypothetical protein U0905_15830 [Pirellulales bacterium]